MKKHLEIRRQKIETYMGGNGHVKGTHLESKMVT
jgi:hypothetical protein